MKRYAAFDPPEYVAWRPLPAVIEEFAAVLARHAGRATFLRTLAPERHLALYAGLVRFRLHDIMLKRWVRQGILSKAWLGTGEEAVAVGNVHALQEGDLVGPMIRNAGACHEMGMPVADLFRAYLGTADQMTRGRDLHTGDTAHGVVPPISFVASLVPVMAGMALAARLRGEDRLALTWVGDGASRTAEFHEGLNLAAVNRLPLILVLEDNGVALGTRREAHSRAPMDSLPRAYGVQGFPADGNNVLDVLAATREAAEACRSGSGPALVLATTFRMGGHATHDEAEGRALFPAATFAHWGARDPIGMYEAWLTGGGRPARRGVPPPSLTVDDLSRVEQEVFDEVEKAALEALASQRDRMPDPATLEEDVLGTGSSAADEPSFAPLRLGAGRVPARS